MIATAGGGGSGVSNRLSDVNAAGAADSAATAGGTTVGGRVSVAFAGVAVAPPDRAPSAGCRPTAGTGEAVAREAVADVGRVAGGGAGRKGAAAGAGGCDASGGGRVGTLSDGAIPIPFATRVEGKTVVGVRSGTGLRVITGAVGGASRVWNPHRPASAPITNVTAAGTTQRFNTGLNRGPNRKAWVVVEVE